MTETETIQDPEALPWEESEQRPTIHARVHILAPEPRATFNSKTYPSLELSEHSRPDDVTYADAIISVTGTAEQRRAFANQLHDVADAIYAWTEADR